jgi:hypothetical protein
MKTSLSILAAALASIVPSIHAFAGAGMNKNAANMNSNTVDTGISRRESFANIASVVGGIAGIGIVSLPNAANAMPTDETPRIITKMGGLLVSLD